LLGPVLVVLLLALVVRGRGLRFRVDVVNSTPAGPIVARLETNWPLPAPPAQPTGPQTLPAEDAEPQSAVEQASTAEDFDLGPSYEEEQQARADAARQQEQALLQEIFEHNLRLLEQIEHTSSDEEGDPESGE
jgi:hypothetical protein